MITSFFNCTAAEACFSVVQCYLMINTIRYIILVVNNYFEKIKNFAAAREVFYVMTEQLSYLISFSNHERSSPSVAVTLPCTMPSLPPPRTGNASFSFSFQARQSEPVLEQI